MNYDVLLLAADACGLTTKEKDLQAFDGRIKGTRVAIRKTIPTQMEKACVLAEELGHYFTSAGDVMDNSSGAEKQERRARLWAYDLQIGLSGLIHAYTAGCRNIFEMADYLNVSEPFLRDALECYQEKYGTSVCYDGYRICLDPVSVEREEDADENGT